MKSAPKEPYGYKEILQQLEKTQLDEHGIQVLRNAIREIQWIQNMPKPTRMLQDRHPIHKLPMLPAASSVGCPGVPGAYTHMACVKLFPHGDIHFYEEFADVVDAVVTGEVPYAVLPVENSSAGQVGEVLDLISTHNLYINQTTDIKVEHCLCCHPQTDPATITAALSHIQALTQCKGYLAQKGLASKRYSNTAAAAKEISTTPRPMACVCSRLSAELYGLRILEEGIQDFDENYTRFICISPQNILLPGADTISITLSIPHEPGYLAKLLTCFAACNLDLTRLVSKPIASRDFSVLFYLDFQGNIEDRRVTELLSALYDECAFFQFHGNFRRLP